MDVLLSQAGWKSIDVPVKRRNQARSDVLDYKLPAWMDLKSQLHDGHLPLWNDKVAGGVPGLQLSTRSGLTPAFLVFAAIPDDALGFYLSGLTNLLLAMSGMYLFLRRLSLDRWASVFGALVFTASGFHIAWYYWHHVNTSIWMPWLLCFVVAYIDERRSVHLAGVAIAGALMLLGGYPAVAMYGFMAAGLFTVVMLWGRRGSPVAVVRDGWPLAVAVAGSVLLAWFGLQPLLEQLGHTAVDYRGGGSNMQMADLARFWNPWAEDGKPGSTLHFGLPALALSALAVLFFRRLPARLPALFAIALALITLVVVFALVPREWIRLIPGFQLGGSWNRMSVLFPLAAAVLSANAFSLVVAQARHWPGVAVVVIVVLLGLQLTSQCLMFRYYNGVVPAASFLPETATIRHVSDHLRPLQGVIADAGAYLPSGTLGAWGIPEWFAHDFKSPQEKRTLSQLVRAPFRTPTASMPRCWDVEADQRQLALLGIRYLLCRDVPSPELDRDARVSRARISQPLPPFAVETVFEITQAVTAQTLAVSITPPVGPAIEGRLVLTVQSAGQATREASIEAAAAQGRRWARFTFPEPLLLPPGEHRLRLDWVDAAPDSRLSVLMQTTPAGSSAYSQEILTPDQLVTSDSLEWLLQVDGEPFLADGAVASRTPLDQRMRRLELEPGLTLYENPMAGASGAYFLPALSGDGTPEFPEVRLDAYAPGRVELSYLGHTPGWVVLPMRWYPGWHAKVDGQDATVERFLDLVPAIAVNGPAQIEFRYAPRAYYRAAWLSASAWLALLVFVFVARRRQGRDSGPP